MSTVQSLLEDINVRTNVHQNHPLLHNSRPVPIPQACDRCMRRYKCAPTHSDSPHSPNAKRLRPSPPPPTTTTTHSFCPLCFGILQLLTPTPSTDPSPYAVNLTPAALTAESIADPFGPAAPPPPPLLPRFASLPDAIHAIIKAWEFDSIALDFSVPAALAVRQHVFKLRTSGTGTAGTIETVKEAARAMFVKEIKSIFASASANNGSTKGIQIDPLAPMRLSIQFQLPPDFDQETQWLAPHPLKRSRKQRLMKQKREDIDARVAVWSSSCTVQKLESMSIEDFNAKCPASALDLLSTSTTTTTAVQSSVVVLLTPTRRPVFVGGRYRKLQRGIPQSPWEGRSTTSVQQEIAKVVLPPFEADEYTFLASGREDIDVRMLGQGRPFGIEIKNARRLPEDLNTNSSTTPPPTPTTSNSVEWEGVGVLSDADVAALKTSAEEKRKTYAAVCWIPRTVTDEDIRVLNEIVGGQGEGEGEGRELVLQQETPLRVVHRRANVVRQRSIYEIHAEKMVGNSNGTDNGGRYVLVRLTTAAGTYVKEFVHGDRGRTTPSIKELLKVERAECRYLDVLDVVV